MLTLRVIVSAPFDTLWKLAGTLIVSGGLGVLASPFSCSISCLSEQPLGKLGQAVPGAVSEAFPTVYVAAWADVANPAAARRASATSANRNFARAPKPVSSRARYLCRRARA